MIEVEGLEVKYGGTITALRGVDINLTDQGVVAVLGNNGAGKSTLLRAVSGTLRMMNGRVTGGRVRFGGRDITNEHPAAIVRSGVVQAPEGRRIFGRLTVDENLRAGASTVRSRAERARSLARVYELFPMLEQFRSQRGALLSGGQQQMLAIGRALMSEPKVLLLDEPSLGLAPLVVEQVGEIVHRIHQEGTPVMIIEQNAAMALSVATYAYVLELGRVSLAGTAEDLTGSDRIRELYLGVGSAAERRAALTAAAGSGRHLAQWDRRAS
jgi:branched-chain amino acid transport system ATP-binding protein